MRDQKASEEKACASRYRGQSHPAKFKRVFLYRLATVQSV